MSPKKNSQFMLVPLFLLLFSTFFSLSVIFTQHDLSNAFATSSNSADIVDEGNSTYVKPSQANGQENNISTVIVIQNPDSNASADTASNKNTDDPEVGQLTLSNETEMGLQEDKNTQISSAAELKTSQQSNNMTNASSSSSSFQNETQRGLYLVDNNGVHYYNVNNCSLVKGSSGVGDLSECEEAEREIQEELTG